MGLTMRVGERDRKGISQKRKPGDRNCQRNSAANQALSVHLCRHLQNLYPSPNSYPPSAQLLPSSSCQVSSANPLTTSSELSQCLGFSSFRLIVLIEVVRMEIGSSEGSSRRVSLSEKVVLVLLAVEAGAVYEGSGSLPSTWVLGHATNAMLSKWIPGRAVNVG